MSYDLAEQIYKKYKDINIIAITIPNDRLLLTMMKNKNEYNEK